MRYNRLILKTILLLFPFFALAQTPAQQLFHQLGNIKTMRANFVQTIYANKAVQSVVKGEMALQRPGRFYWSVEAPYKQLIVAKDGYAWVYDPSLQQATKRSMGHAGDNPAQLLSASLAQLQSQYNVAQYPIGSHTVYELTPKSQQKMFQHVNLIFAGQQLQRMELIDNLGQYSIFAFSNIKENIKIDPQLFVYKPQKNVDIVTI